MNQHQLQIAIINFKFQGPNHTVSLDGHDKLCGYQKSMFSVFMVLKTPLVEDSLHKNMD